MKNVLVLNDEAHHCYREKPDSDEGEDLKGDERKEAERNNQSGSPLDLRAGGREPQARPDPSHRPVS